MLAAYHETVVAVVAGGQTNANAALLAMQIVSLLPTLVANATALGFTGADRSILVATNYPLVTMRTLAVPELKTSITCRAANSPSGMAKHCPAAVMTCVMALPSLSTKA